MSTPPEPVPSPSEPGTDNGMLALVSPSEQWTPDGIARRANGQFETGWKGGPGGLKGARKAVRLLDRSAPSLVKHGIQRAKQSDTVLNKLLDKIIPDAGKDSSPTVNVGLAFISPTSGRLSEEPFEDV